MVSKSQTQFHRRSRYEDILELVNDNEEALKPFPNRDAVFYKASNKGSYFDGKDHLDRLKVEQRRINERIVRDQMLREYATDNDLTHRALWDAGASARADSPTRPQMFHIGSEEPAEQYGNDEFIDRRRYKFYTSTTRGSSTKSGRVTTSQSTSNSPSAPTTGRARTTTRRRHIKNTRAWNNESRQKYCRWSSHRSGSHKHL